MDSFVTINGTVKEKDSKGFALFMDSTVKMLLFFLQLNRKCTSSLKHELNMSLTVMLIWEDS